jgi:hypothetical protein
MEDKINKIWYQMNMKEITSEQTLDNFLKSTIIETTIVIKNKDIL